MGTKRREEGVVEGRAVLEKERKGQILTSQIGGQESWR